VTISLIDNHWIHVFSGEYGKERWWTHDPEGEPPEIKDVVWIDLGWWHLGETQP
jgi:hypothetical protein